MHMCKPQNLKQYLGESEEGLISQERNLETMCYFYGSNSVFSRS